MKSRLWPPAAATSSARFAASWPRTSARSDGGLGRPGASRGRRRGRERPLAEQVAERLGERRDAEHRQRRRAPPPRRRWPIGQQELAAARCGAPRSAMASAAAHRAARAPSRPSSPQSSRPASASSGSAPWAREQREGDREVEVVALLAQVGRRQVDRHRARRQVEAAVAERRAHPLAALAHGGVGQADDLHLRQAGLDVDLDLHRPGFDPPGRGGERAGEHLDRTRTDFRPAISRAAVVRSGQRRAPGRGIARLEAVGEQGARDPRQPDILIAFARVLVERVRRPAAAATAVVIADEVGERSGFPREDRSECRRRSHGGSARKLRLRRGSARSTRRCHEPLFAAVVPHDVHDAGLIDREPREPLRGGPASSFTRTGALHARAAIRRSDRENVRIAEELVVPDHDERSGRAGSASAEGRFTMRKPPGKHRRKRDSSRR